MHSIPLHGLKTGLLLPLTRRLKHQHLSNEKSQVSICGKEEIDHCVKKKNKSAMITLFISQAEYGAAQSLNSRQRISAAKTRIKLHAVIGSQRYRTWHFLDYHSATTD